MTKSDNQLNDDSNVSIFLDISCDNPNSTSAFAPSLTNIHSLLPALMINISDKAGSYLCGALDRSRGAGPPLPYIAINV